MADKRKWIEGAFETGAQTLLELINTPQLTKLHFEFDVEVGEIPTMQYVVTRLSIKEEQESEDSDG